MYRYDEHDRAFIAARVEQFRDQVQRRLRGQLTDEEFAPLRLQNGLYLQRHAHMLRVAIPYGTLSARQLLGLADVADRYDRGYGHFTTRQNIQFNWLELADVPDVLDDLATVDMHAIQTSGNCVRNITCDPFAGVAADEIRDARPIAELLRQWSTLHPEFAHLPRKFKIAVTGAARDRTAVYFHDIGLRLRAAPAGGIRFEIIVGGGQGRTPAIGQVLYADVALADLLPRLESILRVYNLHGRRDNKYKARIKILLKDLGLDALRTEVDADFASRDRAAFALVADELARIERDFALPLDALDAGSDAPGAAPHAGPLRRWLRHNTFPHRHPGRAIVVVTLKGGDRAPGDVTSDEMRGLAAIAAQYSCAEIRVSHEQNLVLPHVRRADLDAVYVALDALGLAAGNHALITDLIACPGRDYCSLANARSIPLAQQLAAHFADPAAAEDIGALAIKISGCMNACGHHHVGHIGILGVEKGGREFYQLTLGGEAGERPALGDRLGPAVTATEAIETIDALLAHYRRVRVADETFIEVVRRTGTASFKEALHDAHR